MNKIKKGQIWIATDGRMRVIDQISPSRRRVYYFDSIDHRCLGGSGKHIQVASFLKWIRRSDAAYWYYITKTKTTRLWDGTDVVI